jgi:hypothetical protein
MAFDFFYDAQIRRWLLQFIRVFSLIKMQTAPDSNGVVTENSIPVVYGDISRIVATLLKGNSENTLPPSPSMSVWIKELEMAPERRLNPYYVGKLGVDERELLNGQYTQDGGNRYTIERYMPVPYNMILELYLWTTNTTTKLQILEQIMTIFNPSIQIQQNMNLLDWTVMTDIELLGIVWSNRLPDQGTESQRDIATLTFKIPIWINPPAKVKQRKLIEEIIINVYDTAKLPDESIDKYFSLDPIKSCFNLEEQLIVTPGNHKIKIGVDNISATQILLLDSFEKEDPTVSWISLLNKYGTIRPGISYITLKINDDIESEVDDILGKISIDEDHPNLLNFEVDVDTLPATISSGPIDKIINPLTSWPGHNLPTAVVGQRYLLLNDIPLNTGTNPWGSVNGHENDIIEFDGYNWNISFLASNEAPNQYVKSLTSYQSYKFNGDEWVNTYFGIFNPGYWRIHL